MCHRHLVRISDETLSKADSEIAAFNITHN